jgi:hypothetical protein
MKFIDPQSFTFKDVKVGESFMWLNNPYIFVKVNNSGYVNLTCEGCNSILYDIAATKIIDKVVNIAAHGIIEL